MRHPKVPKGAITVASFSEFLEYRDKFFDGYFSLLIALGASGLSKSWYFREAANRKDSHGKPRAHVLRGYARPFQIYKELFWHQDEKIVIDDAESLWKESSGTGRTLIRQLTELEDPNELSWTTANQQLDAEGIPRKFKTRSKLAIICNDFFFGTKSEDVAIRDRAILLHFQPTPLEVYVQASAWFWDQEILDYFRSRLHAMAEVTARALRKCWDLKQAGMDWRKYLDAGYCYDPSIALVQELEQKGLKPPQRVQEFKEKTGASQATYYRLRDRLEKRGQLTPVPPPHRSVRGKPPKPKPEELPKPTLKKAAKAKPKPVEAKSTKPAKRKQKKAAKPRPKKRSVELEKGTGEGEDGLRVVG